MINTIDFLNYLLPVLYLGAFSVYLYNFISEKKNFEHSKRLALFITLLVHCIYLAMRTFEFNHPPITNRYEIFTVLAFSITCSYFLLELLTDIRGTGLFILPFALVFQAISSLYITESYVVKDVLRNNLLGLHVMSALLGYAGFTISAVHGVLFLMLYKKLKGSNFGLIFKKMPSLETLEKLSFSSVVIGFTLLTIAILIGGFWLPSAFPNFKYSDPKLISSALIWTIYAIGILIKYLGGWYGRKVINTTLLGFALTLLSLLLINVLGSSFHTFS
ncbi:MAG: cytochrome c biogenesis protein CcsA [Melioribacteraceae bacterium]|nr:cytochrome c biogenesis protein CcsA [Melioribacteraceae bacterium]